MNIVNEKKCFPRSNVGARHGLMWVPGSEDVGARHRGWRRAPAGISPWPRAKGNRPLRLPLPVWARLAILSLLNCFEVLLNPRHSR